MRPFQYSRARTLADAAQMLAEPETTAIAGGTNLLDLMKLQVETPGQLADVNRVGFAEIEDIDDGGLRIGAGATLRAVKRNAVVVEKYAALADACGTVATPTIESSAR